MKRKQNIFRQKRIELRKALDRLPRLLATDALEFFRQGIAEQKDVDGQPYAPRTFNTRKRAGRALLIQSGALRRSLRIIRLTKRSALLGSSLPYAQIHNEGGQVPITPNMRKFFWSQYYQNATKVKKRKDGQKSNAKGSQQADREANMWKALALKKSPIKIPKRHFIGRSKRIEDLLKDTIKRELDKIFKR